MTYLDVGSNDRCRADMEDVASAQGGLVHQVGFLFALKAWTAIVSGTSVDTVVVLTDIAGNVHQTIQTSRVEGNTHIRMNGFNSIDTIVQHKQATTDSSPLVGLCQIFQHRAGTAGNGQTGVFDIGHPVVPSDVGRRLQDIASAIVIFKGELQADRRTAGGIHIDVVFYRMYSLTNLFIDVLTGTVTVVPVVLLYHIGKVSLCVVRPLGGTLIMDKQECSLLKEAIGINHVQVVRLVGQPKTHAGAIFIKSFFCSLSCQVIAHHDDELIVLPATGKGRYTASGRLGNPDIHDIGSVRLITRKGTGSRVPVESIVGLRPVIPVSTACGCEVILRTGNLVERAVFALLGQIPADVQVVGQIHKG